MNDLVAALTKAGAPILGTLIGGPVGTIAGAAIGALAEALGTPATAEAVKEAIETRPDAAAIVKQVEATKATELNADLEAILRDRQAARDQTLSLVDKASPLAWGAPLVSIFVLGTFSLVMGYAIIRGIPPGSEGTLMYGLIETLKLMSVSVVSYWVGSSAGSAAKDAAIKQFASK
jgi:hypothetical protein